MNISEFSLPGAWSAPFSFASYQGTLGNTGDGNVPCAVEPSCDTAKSPICSYGITAGDNTIDMCRPPPPNCPMSRPLVPERNIEPGMWTYQVPKKTQKVEKVENPSPRYDLIEPIIMIACVMVVLSVLSRD